MFFGPVVSKARIWNFKRPASCCSVLTLESSAVFYQAEGIDRQPAFQPEPAGSDYWLLGYVAGFHQH
jgi:hypothetical protein